MFSQIILQIGQGFFWIIVMEPDIKEGLYHQ